jgi:hypothetical protein
MKEYNTIFPHRVHPASNTMFLSSGSIFLAQQIQPLMMPFTISAPCHDILGGADNALHGSEH